MTTFSRFYQIGVTLEASKSFDFRCLVYGVFPFTKKTNGTCGSSPIYCSRYFGAICTVEKSDRQAVMPSKLE
jgi:hypothetical protein